MPLFLYLSTAKSKASLLKNLQALEAILVTFVYVLQQLPQQEKERRVLSCDHRRVRAARYNRILTEYI